MRFVVGFLEAIKLKRGGRFSMESKFNSDLNQCQGFLCFVWLVGLVFVNFQFALYKNRKRMKEIFQNVGFIYVWELWHHA